MRMTLTKLVLAAAVAIGLFENCMGAQRLAVDTSTPASALITSETTISGSGNGQGYGGMTFIELQFSGCADGTQVRSRILLTTGNVAYLQRDNCAPLTPATTLPLGSYTLSPSDPSLLIVTQASITRTFARELPATAGSQICDKTILATTVAGAPSQLCNLIVAAQSDGTIAVQTVIQASGPGTLWTENFVGCYLQDPNETQISNSLTVVGHADSGANFAGAVTGSATLSFVVAPIKSLGFTGLPYGTFRLRCSLYASERLDFAASLSPLAYQSTLAVPITLVSP